MNGARQLVSIGAAGTSRPPDPARRVRVPPPLIRSRLPSGRGATEQPNATGDGDAALTPVFWMMVAATGVAAGLFGDMMMLLLFSVQHLAFGYHAGTLEAAVSRASDARRIVVLLAAGAFGGAAWYLLRRCTPGERTEIDDVVWGDGERLSFRRSLGTSMISEVVIGMGASIGRENAPKLMGGASASLLAGWARLSPAQRRLLMACGGGAGLAGGTSCGDGHPGPQAGCGEHRDVGQDRVPLACHRVSVHLSPCLVLPCRGRCPAPAGLQGAARVPIGGRVIRPAVLGPRSLPPWGTRRQGGGNGPGKRRAGGDGHDDVLVRRRLGLVAGGG